MPAFREVLQLVGQLNYTWTNTESLLIYVIARLAKLEREPAIIIFLTLNTSKARMELVERLAKMASTPPRDRDEVLPIMAQLLRQSRIRNKYSHCIYSFDEGGNRASTQLMRLVESKDAVHYGKVEDLGDAEVRKITDSIATLQALNRRIWDFVKLDERDQPDADIGSSHGHAGVPAPVRIPADARP